MTTSFSRAPEGRAKRLAATLYAYTLLDEFVLFYPFYALLFVDTGLSTAEISSLLVIWSVTSVVLEVPSGVWADAVSRRALLALAPLLAAVGFGLWGAAPSYWVFAVGFVLWGASGALQSGALEALVYTELDHLGAAGRYAAIMGRARAVGTGAAMVSMAVAAPVFAVGGYSLVAAGSVLACVLAAVAALAFPEHRVSPGREAEAAGEGETPEGGYAAILREGLRAARADRSTRRALLLVPAVTALWGSLEEYTPLLAIGTGVATHVVPLLVLLVSVGIAAGGLLAAAGRSFTDREFAALLAFGALALGAGAVSGVAAGFVALAVAFCVFQMASVLADVRLQESITGPARATVTSLAGVGTEVGAVLVYGGYAAASALTGHAAIFTASAVPYAVLALVLFLGGSRSRRAETVRAPLGDP
ncbi:MULTISPECIES: MFS transporter [unclassified Streptosporangium]|uniref:MFS transporter n=1 Tax=unclassified Streptosporangium TaxID=2632669 RepID=UPI002E2C694E|nr:MULTISPECIES: MFS transporter [unclassified Streptosporangium]